MREGNNALIIKEGEIMIYVETKELKLGMTLKTNVGTIGEIVMGRLLADYLEENASTRDFTPKCEITYTHKGVHITSGTWCAEEIKGTNRILLQIILFLNENIDGDLNLVIDQDKLIGRYTTFKIMEIGLIVFEGEKFNVYIEN